MMTDIPRRRAFTLSDGTINFRGCLEAARDFADRAIRRHLYGDLPVATTLDWKEKRSVRLRVHELVECENAAWAALSPSIRAAATLFDQTMDVRNIECTCDVSRRDAILALAGELPAVWDTSRQGPKNPAVSMINYAATLVDPVAARAEATNTLVGHYADLLGTLIPLNAAGEQFLRNARNARALRRQAIAA